MAASNPKTDSKDLEEILGDVWVAGHDYAGQPDGLEALRSANMNNRVALEQARTDFAALIAKECQKARIEVIEKIYELSPKAKFGDWKPKDALMFYERFRAYEQQLTKEQKEL
jgi:hypothetical protein